MIANRASGPDLRWVVPSPTKTTEKKVGEVLASLARLGYVTSEDGKTFALRRVA